LFSVLSIGVVVLAPPASAQSRPPIADKIAKAYGFDSFVQVEAIRYTFNIDAGKLKLSRSWIWEPGRDQISYEGKDSEDNPVKITYSHSQLASQSAVVKGMIDPAFFNDQYMLLLPFHLVWDTGATIQDAGKQEVPLGPGTAEKVVVKYPSEGGYTPGDTWELYVGPDGKIRNLVFHRGGTAKPSLLIVTWADHKKAGPILVSLDKRGTADGKPARIFFTDVAIKLRGSSTWMDAK